jgi:hypothetical protein
MSILPSLDFKPVPLRSGLWVSEATGIMYSIFQSTSGFVVHVQRFGTDDSDNTPSGGATRVMHPTFQAAVEACQIHYQSLRK